jgi:hypothetical protein
MKPRNIVEIPEGTKTALVVLEGSNNTVSTVALTVAPEWKMATLLFGAFVSCLEHMERNSKERGKHDVVEGIASLRESFNHLGLEEIRSNLSIACKVAEGAVDLL